MQLNIKNIPLYLQNGDLYQELKDNDNDELIEVLLEVDIKYYQNEIIILNNEDLINIIELCRYWMVNTIPNEVFQFVFENNLKIDIEKIKEKFYDYTIFIKCIQVILNSDKDDLCKNASRIGSLDLLKFLHNKSCPWDENTCSSAAENGHLDCLKYAHKNGCRLDGVSWNKISMIDISRNVHSSIPWNGKTCSSAAENGHLDCLKYAHENGCPLNKNTCSYAAKNGHLDCLKYAHENGSSWNEGSVFSQNACSSAAENGHLDCLKYARENGCPWNENTCSLAAENGHLDCLKYARENGCPWNENTCSPATKKKKVNNSLDCEKSNLPNNNVYSPIYMINLFHNIT
jgi:hypothetical protein